MLTIVNPLAPATPQPVFLAVRLMYTGAALAVLLPIVSIVIAPQVGVFRVGSTSVVEFHTRQVGTAVFSGSVDCALWLWMAWKNKSGRAWARTLSTIFFAGFCVGMFVDVHRGPIEVSALAVICWLVALGAVILLWRPESGPFYRDRPAFVEAR
jgi:hypothetical protein